ncbi:hypothetical protein [Euryhalocaulis caribicus]|uniref:hypothetical protein n=1 Tax=Euryhalocaulis caribicus TaxID=1161401 RepID=UPI00039AB537|nr:hypothetical protein [Euryhalocaulis caribicus]
MARTDEIGAPRPEKDPTDYSIPLIESDQRRVLSDLYGFIPHHSEEIIFGEIERLRFDADWWEDAPIDDDDIGPDEPVADESVLDEVTRLVVAGDRTQALIVVERAMLVRPEEDLQAAYDAAPKFSPSHGTHQ